MTLSADYNGHSLVFIVGCPRSGTTWLQKLLAAHPHIHTGQESHLFNRFIGPQLRAWEKLNSRGKANSSNRRVGLPAYLSEEEFLRSLRSYLLTLLDGILSNTPPGDLFLEKTPHHALWIPEIHALLPAARFIEIRRDPRDVVASLLAASASWANDWAPSTIDGAVTLWLRHVQAVEAADSECPDLRLHRVTYENLQQAPEEALTKISEFLEIDWSDIEVKRAIEANRLSRAIAGGGTRIPVGGALADVPNSTGEPTGFVRRGESGGWRKDLSWKQKLQLWRILRKASSSYGYPWRSPLR